MWSELHRPKTLAAMVGNEEARDKFQAWLAKWKKGGKAALLVGPPGTGKTTTVHLVAQTLHLNLVELNASDTRTKTKLSEKLGEIIDSTGLFGERSLIFLDEVDGLAGRSDYGAVDFIKETVRRSHYPVVMAANNPESDEVRKLAGVALGIIFVPPSPEDVEKFLKRILREEGVEVPEEEVRAVAEAAGGDVRAAINALQSGLPGANDRALTSSQAVNQFFEASDYKSALVALRAYPGQPRDKVRDLYASVVKGKVHAERKAAALEVLSRADLLMGRIMRGQDWRLLRYLDPLLASELRSALGDGGVRYSTEAVPWPLQVRIWNDSKKLREIAGLVGRRLKTSQRSSLVADIPYLMILCSEGEFREELVKTLDLEENYAAFIANEAQRSKK